MSFLPSEYKEPENINGYMKLIEGNNSFRILSSAIVGWEYWTKDKKPVRSKTPFEETPNIKKNPKTGQDEPVKEFWAFVVFNYHVGKIQILEITQKTIKSGIQSLIDNPKWGDIFKYDVVITKTVTGDKTTYQVIAEPPVGETKESIVEEYKGMKINLEALYDGKDPFSE